jgi:hypothetical protein
MSPNDLELPLIDWLYAKTFGKPVPQWRSNKRMRQALTIARRFLMNDRMAAFLADVAATAFIDRNYTNLVKLDQLRPLARLPHADIWVEHELSAYNKRETELIGDTHYDLPNSVKRIREGWLLQSAPGGRNTEFRAFLFHRLFHDDGSDELQCFPVGIYWRTDDDYLVRPDETRADEDATYFTRSILLGTSLGNPVVRQHKMFRQVALLRSDGLLADQPEQTDTRSLGMGTGVLTRIWAFLATINDIPVLARQFSQARGFMARAQYRRFLDHKILTLQVPQKVDYKKLARSVVAHSKRRAHQVRGHWRKDWRHPPNPLCDHQFETIDDIVRCKLCQGQRFFIREHLRGDATVGLVTHDYNVVRTS